MAQTQKGNKKNGLTVNKIFGRFMFVFVVFSFHETTSFAVIGNRSLPPNA
jgi:hypothetical protein